MKAALPVILLLLVCHSHAASNRDRLIFEHKRLADKPPPIDIAANSRSSHQQEPTLITRCTAAQHNFPAKEVKKTSIFILAMRQKNSFNHVTCRKVIWEISKLNQYGIEVQYLTSNTETITAAQGHHLYSQLQQLWCKHKNLDQHCSVPFDEFLLLKYISEFSVLTILENGMVLPGIKTAGKIAEKLGLL